MKLKKKPEPSATNGWREVSDREAASEMELQPSPVLDGRMAPDHGIRGTALGKCNRQEPPWAGTFLGETILSRDGDVELLQRTPGEGHDSDNYQVALVPVGHERDRLGSDFQGPLKPIVMLPLTWRELVLHLRAGVSASESVRERSVVRFGEVFIDFHGMEVRRSEEKVALTSMEFKMLRFLVQNAGRVISRDEMLNDVWGYENYPCTRTVDNHILRLRQKLELDPARPIHFQTVHGVGYKFVFEARHVMPEREM